MTNLIELFLVVLGTVVTGVLLPALTTWLKSKISNEQLKAVIADLSHTVSTSVKWVEQTMVWQLKQDGKWDLDSQQQVLATCAAEVVKNLTNDTKRLLSKENIDLEAIVIRYIESQISAGKLAGSVSPLE